jgi:hypothetical protein
MLTLLEMENILVYRTKIENGSPLMEIPLLLGTVGGLTSLHPLENGFRNFRKTFFSI